MTDEELHEAVRRTREPDGDCLHCRRPADRLHPVGPLWVTIREPDANCSSTHFAVGNALASGPLGRQGACSLSTRTDHTVACAMARLSARSRNGFQVAGDLGLERIPFGAARFVHVWGTDVRIPPELANRVVPQS